MKRFIQGEDRTQSTLLTAALFAFLHSVWAMTCRWSRSPRLEEGFNDGLTDRHAGRDMASACSSSKANQWAKALGRQQLAMNSLVRGRR